MSVKGVGQLSNLHIYNWEGEGGAKFLWDRERNQMTPVKRH